MTPNRPPDDRALADALLAALWPRVWKRGYVNDRQGRSGRWGHLCGVCGEVALDKLAVRHLPGCVLARVPADRLAAAAGWEEAGEPT